MASETEKKSSWAQPSLSRDFALLSFAIIFIMVLISAWVAWITYVKHSERIDLQLAKESERIERTLETEIESTRHLLTSMGRQIAAMDDGDEKIVEIAKLLQSFSTGNPKYALWSWADERLKVLVSSTRGILKEPVDISDRDYLQKSLSKTWQLHIGQPIEGRVSDRWVIPVSMGISDATGEVKGALTASIDINALTDQISHLVKREGISFAIVSRRFMPLTVVTDAQDNFLDSLPMERLKKLDLKRRPAGLMTRASLFSDNQVNSYYKVSNNYPYIILVAYDSQASDTAIRSLLWPRLIQIGVVAAFLLSFLWIIRSRVIKPVVKLNDIAAEVGRGKPYAELDNTGPQEIEQLSDQIRTIAEYIAERRRVEQELRNKIVQLQRRQERGSNDIRQRSMLLAGLLSEYKQSLHHINGLAQKLKEQHYGAIANANYRQCAADIHQTGTTLELMVRKMIALSRVDANAVVTRDETARLSRVIRSAHEFIESSLHEQNITPYPLSNVEALSDMPVKVDRLHLQQSLAYVLLYLMLSQCSRNGSEEDSLKKPDGYEPVIRLQQEMVYPSREEEVLVFAVGLSRHEQLDKDVLAEIVGSAECEGLCYSEEDTIEGQLHLTLSYSLLSTMNITLARYKHPDHGLWCVLCFPADRIADPDDKNQL